VASESFAHVELCDMDAFSNLVSSIWLRDRVRSLQLFAEVNSASSAFVFRNLLEVRTRKIEPSF
jgi:hypothetical protein